MVNGPSIFSARKDRERNAARVLTDSPVPDWAPAHLLGVTVGGGPGVAGFCALSLAVSSSFEDPSSSDPWTHRLVGRRVLAGVLAAAVLLLGGLRMLKAAVWVASCSKSSSSARRTKGPQTGVGS